MIIISLYLIRKYKTKSNFDYKIKKDITMPEQPEENVDKLIAKLKESEDYWMKTIEKLTVKLNCSAKDVIPLQAEAISLRQQVAENIKDMSYELFKLVSKIKVARKQLFEFYSTTYSLPTNATEKAKLIEWDLHKQDQQKNNLDNHIEFLRECLKDMDNINFAIKNKISLYQLTDLE